MKPKNNKGVASILFETDMKKLKPINKDSLSDLQKHCLSMLSEKEQENILAGQAAVVVDLEKESEICSFNMSVYKPPQHAIDAFARSILPDIQEFYSHEENQKAFEEWQERQDESN